MKISHSKTLAGTPYSFLELGWLPNPYEDPSDLALVFALWLQERFGWDGREELEIVE